MKDRLKFAGIVAAIVVVGLIALVMKFGIRPRPISLMDPSAFETPVEAGRGLYKALWKQLRDRQLVVIGYDKSDSLLSQVWTGFLQAHTEDSSAPEKRAVTDMFADMLPTVATWIVVTDEQGFHGGKDPAIKQAEERWRQSLTSVILVRAKPQDADCGLEVGTVESYRDLECLKILGGRQIEWSRRIPTDKLRAVVNQPGIADFIMILK